MKKYINWPNACCKARAQQIGKKMFKYKMKFVQNCHSI